MNSKKTNTKQTGLRQRQAEGINTHTTSEFEKMKAERKAEKAKKREEERTKRAAEKEEEDKKRAEMEANIQAGISAGFKDTQAHTTNEANRVVKEVGDVMEKNFDKQAKKIEYEMDLVKKDKSKLQTTVRKQNTQLADNDTVFKAITHTVDDYTESKTEVVPSGGFKNADDFLPEDATSLEAVLAAFNELKANYATVKDLFEEADDSLEIIGAAVEQAHLDEVKSPVKEDQAKKFISSFKGLKGVKKNIAAKLG